tara:strand:- start:89 stop:262 length:174 start_codon:yes stop_codon:yes gene_type:complete
MKSEYIDKKIINEHINFKYVVSLFQKINVIDEITIKGFSIENKTDKIFINEKLTIFF